MIETVGWAAPPSRIDADAYHFLACVQTLARDPVLTLGGIAWEVWRKVWRKGCRSVDGDPRYGATTVWYGAGMAHNLLSAHIIFCRELPSLSELYLEAVFVYRISLWAA